MSARRPGSGDLERERARAEAAAEDASRAERELLEARESVRQLEAQLARSERRLDALRRQPAVRVVTGIGGRIAQFASAMRSRPRRAGWRSGLVPAMARSFDGVDRRDLPAVYRGTLLAALHGRPASGGPFTVAPFGQMDDLVQGLAARGIEATRDDPLPDAILVTHPGIVPLRLPEGPILIGIHPAVSDDFDILVGPSDEPATAVVEAIDRWLRAPRVGIRIPAPNPAFAETWGDTHFARAFRNALRRAGWPARIRLRHVWDKSFVGVDDVVLDLLGLRETTSDAGAVRVLWQISHPELARTDLYARYDAVFVASDQFAARMADRVGVPVHALHQATDPERFAPRSGGPSHELLFVGGWRQAGRRILEDLLPTDRDLAVYGGRWTPERIDPRHLAGEAIPNTELPAYYGGAAIVLNDHWAGMRREGFLSNRLYDASAAGAFVITDHVDGLESEFDDGIVGYRDRVELHELIDRFLADPEARNEHAERARRAVLDRHTFDHRARRFVELVTPLLPAGPDS
jgi:glycosyltransferase involved in cell wall biosynthesis